jgi:hypothetical protein
MDSLVKRNVVQKLFLDDQDHEEHKPHTATYASTADWWELFQRNRLTNISGSIIVDYSLPLPLNVRSNEAFNTKYMNCCNAFPTEDRSERMGNTLVNACKDKIIRVSL